MSWRVSVAALMVLAAGGCATTAVATEYAGGASLDRYHTYKIEPGPVVTDDTPTLVPDQLVQGRIDGALHKQLASKGLAPVRAKDDADLVVTYRASTEDAQALVVDPTAPPGWAPALTFTGGWVWVQDFNQSTVVIDMLDAGTGQVLWRSTVKARNRDLRSPKFIDQAIAKALTKFPTNGEF